ncbi:MAG TPA: ATP-dependent helicase C-terminal domain-containing protein, partial [Allosphingosinicella sp.]|nr:ATP-dependent helicase C-terminal domain-containing protein [Allosphingosinicella sp.]
ALWGVGDPRELEWLDPPAAAAVDEARRRLLSLGALGEDGRPTPHGKAIAALPLPPRLAHMLVEAEASGWGRTAAEVAVLLSERGLGGNDVDLEARLRRWRGERGQRAEAARGLAKRWEQLCSPAKAGAQTSAGTGPRPSPGSNLGPCLALAFPDRLSRRRDSSGESWISVGGRGFRLDPHSPLARETWLAVGEVSGTAAGARILSAAAIGEEEVEALFGDRIESGARLSFDPATGTVRARRGRRLGSIALSEGQDMKAPAEEVAAALVEGVRSHGLDLLPWSEAANSLRRRTAFAREHDPALPDLSDEALLASLDEWLPLLAAGRRALRDIDPAALSGMLDSRLGWEGRKAVDRLAPHDFETPAGSRHAIDYEAEAGPTVTVRVQALYGLSSHPAVAAGRVPLVLSLTSPAGRPIQTTRDLPGFWSGSWSAVAKEMRGRYPRHPWPDDPAAADPTLRTKKAQSRHSGEGRNP